jgi:hypothetical protein
MKTAELQSYFDSKHIRRDAYYLNGTGASEAYCIEHSPKGWSVFYFERGLRSCERIFSTEDEACNELVTQLESDPSCYIRK